ncbi:MAG TPA: hypothetical protein VKH20_00085 [Solirubrobacterales bacterium]|nr:hypothetical protein [Solirubrobacterales bacterium]
MRPGNHERIPAISEAVRDAVAICDPEGAEVGVTAFFESFEDDDPARHGSRGPAR